MHRPPHHARRAVAARGQATAELAVVLPAVVMLLVILLSAGHAVTVQVRVADAARAGARAVIAGEDTATVHRLTAGLAGEGAQVTVAQDAGQVRVTVARPLAGPLGRWGMSVRGTAAAPPEPGSSP